MSLIENLKAAKALIDTPEKWGKGDDVSNRRLCTMLACSSISLGPTGAFDQMRAALLEALPPHASRSVPQVVNFNDHPDTTHADIMALFDRAITAAERSVASC